MRRLTLYDLALDRTAAIPVAASKSRASATGGMFIGTVPTAVQTIGEDMATAGLVVRDCAGPLELAALGAA